MFDNKPIILNEKLIILIKRKVWKRGENECWPYCGYKINGYGRVTVWIDKYNKDSYLVHRVTYVIANGPFDWDLDVLHNCDNPPCCNPTHLFLGTHQDNMKNRDNKGRCNSSAPQGERNGNAKINREIVNKIRFEASLGISHYDIAKKHGISRRNVDYIVNYNIWKDI